MAGRITKSEQQLRPDPVHNSKVLAKFINCVMLDGKKATAQRSMYKALEMMEKRAEREKVEGMPQSGLEIFERAIDNVRPNVEVRSRRIGGANYQVPMQVNHRRRQSLAFRWIINAARADSGKPIADRLARELYEAAKGEGKAMSTRDQTHRMAEANKAFAHFAF
ncbi:MAG: 30S ribosomal protein S7 [Planctomycetota bacterium]|jgi:small subunit ribosomal protein S7